MLSIYTLDFDINQPRKERRSCHLTFGILRTIITDHLSEGVKTRDLLAGGVLNTMSNCLLLGELVL